MSWQDDPIVGEAPATTESWKNDPIVESPSLASKLARQAGLAARYGIEGITAPFAMLASPINAMMGQPNPAGAISRLLTKAGLPEPQGALERVVGDVSRAGAGSGGMVGLLGAARSAQPAMQGVLDAMTANPATQAMAAGAGGGSAGTARELGAPPWGQFLAGLGGGMLGATLPEVAKAGGRLLTSVVSPFTTGGQERIVGNTLNRFAVNPAAARSNLQQIPSNLEGSVPTTAQAARDPGLSQLERGLANQSPQFAQRYGEQNAARVAALEKISGSESDLSQAIKARQEAANAQYGAAAAQPLVPSVPVDKLIDLMERPAFQSAMKKAQDIAANQGVDIKGSLLDNTVGLHYVKMALDDMIGEGKRQGLGAAQQRAIIGVQKEFLDWLDKASPAYAMARQNYAAASVPINQMEELQRIAGATRMAAPSITGTPIVSQAKWQNVVGRKIGELQDVLTPIQTETLKKIGADLDMGTVVGAGKAVGSNTVQNLTTANILGSTLGNITANNPLLQTLTRPLRWIYQVPETMVADLLTNAMLDPTLARVLMMRASKTSVDLLNRELARLYVGNLVQGAAGGAAITATR